MGGPPEHTRDRGVSNLSDVAEEKLLSEASFDAITLPNTEKEKLRSKKILIIIARAVYFFFVFSAVNQPLYQNEGMDRSPHSPQYGVAFVYADSFDDVLKSGKDLGKGIVP